MKLNIAHTLAGITSKLYQLLLTIVLVILISISAVIGLIVFILFYLAWVMFDYITITLSQLLNK